MSFDTIFDKIKEEIFLNNIFLSSPGGTGKSYLLRQLKLYLSTIGRNVAIVAPTGVAALSVGGTTIHRWAGIKKGELSWEAYVKIINNNPRLRLRWKNIEFLLIDEMSMLGSTLFYKLNMIAKHIRNCYELPFGGIRIVTSGDMLQLPPVKDKYPFENELWKELQFTTFKLTVPYRYQVITNDSSHEQKPEEKTTNEQNNNEHFEMLKRIRIGKYTTEDIQKLMSRVKAYQNKDFSKDLIKPTQLYSLKCDVQYINEQELNKIKSPSFRYACYDSITPLTKSSVEQFRNNEVKIRENYRNYLDTLIPPVVTLKVGAQVMLTYNCDPELGLVNGTRGVVIECVKEGVTIEIKDGRQFMISAVEWEFEENDFRIARRQVPFILAYALTIHKSQSATLDCCVLSLGTSIFTAGQAYVALSRCRNLEGIYLIDFIPEKIFADEKALEFEKYLNDEN